MNILNKEQILKSDHAGEIVSEDIRTAEQAVAKICVLGSPWADVNANEIKVCRLHFRKEGLSEHMCPSPGVVLYVERDGLVAFVKAFKGETERIAAVSALKDVWTDCRSGKINNYDENTTFRTYNGVWAWQNGRIVDAKILSSIKRRKQILRELEKDSPCEDKDEVTKEKIATLKKEIAEREQMLLSV